MKAIILAGGFGTRISEESDFKPKPMIEIGGRPLIWHIMKNYANFGITNFIICLGYKGHVIKEFFNNYSMHMSDMTIDLSSNEVTLHKNQSEPWNITLIETGLHTQTGGRLKRLKRYIGNETFCMTYGDGLANIDIREELKFHRKKGKLATVAAVRPPGRFGVLNIGADGIVDSFSEKPTDEIGWINGGFFVLEPEVFNYIDSDETSWEHEPLTQLSEDGELVAYRHDGFWQPCDTLRDKRYLENLWQNDKPWCTWL